MSVSFATWREAVAHLRARIRINGAQLSPDAFGELLAGRAKKGSARSWTSWLRAAPGGRLNGDDTAAATRELAHLFLVHWPTAVTGAVHTRDQREDHS